VDGEGLRWKVTTRVATWDANSWPEPAGKAV